MKHNVALVSPGVKRVVPKGTEDGLLHKVITITSNPDFRGASKPAFSALNGGSDSIKEDRARVADYYKVLGPDATGSDGPLIQVTNTMLEHMIKSEKKIQAEGMKVVTIDKQTIFVPMFAISTRIRYGEKIKAVGSKTEKSRVALIFDQA